MLGKYNFNLLNSFCKENDITLLADYNNLYLEYQSKILLKCKQCLCETEKCFAYMVKTKNALCKKCITINSLPKQKETMLNRYGVEHASQSITIKQSIKQGFIEKYGVDNPSKTKEVKDKMKATNLKRYGVEFLVHNKEIKDKMICTNLEKYGVENPLKNEGIKNKIKKTNIEKYGVDNPAKHIDCINKMKQTNLEKYGVELPLQNSEIYDKLIKTNIERYGVENCLQNPVVLTKQQKSCYKLKEYTMPSGKIINYQGFEHFAIRELLNDNIDEEDIITCKTKTPVVFYRDSNNKKRRHFIDIFVPSRNLCIEVKSQYTITINYDIILLKQKYSKDLGYNYEIWVFDRKGNILDIKK
jgi:hypothetical protein